jgi:glucose uptake protein GlcU
METDEKILAEYSSVRSEILQLNGQAFAIVTGSLTLNFAILGAMFSSQNPLEDLLVLSLIAMLILAAGTILLAHKIRAAHRLTFFQKHFIENRIPEVMWGKIYFKYRTIFDREYKNPFDRLSERFVNAQNFVLIIAQFIDFVILIKYRETSEHTIFIISAVIIVILQCLFLKKINNYKSMKNVFALTEKEVNSTEQKLADS